MIRYLPILVLLAGCAAPPRMTFAPPRPAASFGPRTPQVLVSWEHPGGPDIVFEVQSSTTPGGFSPLLVTSNRFAVLELKEAEFFIVRASNTVSRLTGPWCGEAPDPGLASVTLAWDPSPEPEVTGYFVYWGAASGVYTNRTAPVVGATTVAVEKLPCGAEYFFAATAWTDTGLESDFSEEVSTFLHCRPPPPLNLRVRLIA